MTVAEMAKVIGQRGTLFIEGLDVEIRVDDVRQVWGRTDYQITPIAGAHNKWVSSDRVVLDSVE